jgi:diketogulonate reductase-like aldo/keto reductase
LKRLQVAIERSAVVAAIAERLKVSAVAVVLRWTLARGVAVIPRTANPDKIVENITVGAKDSWFLPGLFGITSRDWA